MREMGIQEAKEHIAEVLDAVENEVREAVENGEEIALSRAGKTVVRLIHKTTPNHEASKASEEAARRMEARSKKYRLDGISLRTLIEEGRA